MHLTQTDSRAICKPLARRATIRRVDWQIKPFAALSVSELYAIMALRQRVFVVEQVAAYLDADGYDDVAEHVFAWDLSARRPGSSLGSPASSPPAPSPPPPPPPLHLATPRGQLMAACARLFAPGVKFAEASIGRVVCAPEWRGHGTGARLMQTCVARLNVRFPDSPIRIGAQRYLEAFYGRLGFVTQPVAPYLEDGIWHIEMVRPAGA